MLIKKVVKLYKFQYLIRNFKNKVLLKEVIVHKVCLFSSRENCSEKIF